MLQLLKGFVSPVFSAQFYQEVLRWRTLKVWVFIFLFILAGSILSTKILAIRFVASVGPSNLVQAQEKLWDGYVEKLNELDFTYVGVIDGQLTTDLRPQPYVVTEATSDGTFFFGIDSTGQLEELPASTANGVLFSQTGLQTRSQTGRTQSYSYARLFSEDWRFTKTELTSESGAARTFYNGIWAWVVVVIVGFFFIVYPLFIAFVMVLQILFFVLVFGFIISLLLPKQVTTDRLSKGFVQAVFLFVPLAYIQGLLNVGIDLLPAQVSNALCLFRLTWVLLAFVYIVFLILPSYRETTHKS